MWDAKKTLAHALGVRKRIEKGLPPFTMTPEERAKMEVFKRESREALARRADQDRKDGKPW
jgi:hypothetical protein